MLQCSIVLSGESKTENVNIIIYLEAQVQQGDLTIYTYKKGILYQYNQAVYRHHSHGAQGCTRFEMNCMCVV